MKIQIIVGSTRPGRITPKLAQWVLSSSKDIQGIDAEIVDLADYELPFFDEAVSPQYNPDRQPSAAAQKWLDKLAEADGFVICTPEYNRSYPGVLKNALDYVDFQFADKPTALVGHGSSGGAQAVSHLRNVVAGLQSVSMPDAIYFQGQVAEMISSEGELHETLKSNPYGPQANLNNLLQKLGVYAEALSKVRA